MSVAAQVAALQAETAAHEHEAQEQQLALAASTEAGDRLRGQIVEVESGILSLKEIRC